MYRCELGTSKMQVRVLLLELACSVFSHGLLTSDWARSKCRES